MRRNRLTKYSKSMLGFDRLGGRFTKHGHHVQEILERQVTILTGAEDVADSLAEWVHAQLRVEEDFRHRELSVLVVANLLWRQGFELVMGTARAN